MPNTNVQHNACILCVNYFVPTARALYIRLSCINEKTIHLRVSRAREKFVGIFFISTTLHLNGNERVFLQILQEIGVKMRALFNG